MPKPLDPRSFHQFVGTEHYYRNAFGLLYTDGVHYLAEQAGAYWLIDAIASHQPRLRQCADERLREFQLWLLTPQDNRGALLTCQADTHTKCEIEQQLDYTDFPFVNNEPFKFYAAPTGQQHGVDAAV